MRPEIEAPQLIDMGREIQVVQLAPDLSEVQPAYVLRQSMQESLAQEPAPLKGIRWVDLVGAP
jgi:hypothetical protein